MLAMIAVRNKIRDTLGGETQNYIKKN